jgi:farnesyl diphosphate synthase
MLDASPFRSALTDAQSRVEAALEAGLPRPTGPEAPIAHAMRYATLGGGKRLRAFMVIETAKLFGVDPAGADRVAAAIECLHAYSLIHDDLPCMDDDDLRRGQPTVHIKWDEATAVLAGDALQTCAFALLADPATHDSAEVRVRLVASLAQAAGQCGMVGGQAADIAAETATTPATLADIEHIQSLKTGALIRWSAEAGAMLGQADAAQTRALTAYATALGLAFQIKDDLLDVEGDADAAGKRLRKDAAAGKATFVSLLGVEEARARALALAEEARSALAPFGAAAATLRDAATYIVTRQT